MTTTPNDQPLRRRIIEEFYPPPDDSGDDLDGDCGDADEPLRDPPPGDE